MSEAVLPNSEHVLVNSVGAGYYVAKRCLDLTVAATLLVVLLPLLVLIAVLIRLDSDGNALYRQDRVGAKRRRRDGDWFWEVQTFSVLKFRSMFADVDPWIHQAHVAAFVNGSLEEATGTDAAYKLPSDPRVTRIGRLLRKTSVDELPQLLNVLKGEMSLVGPRPLPVYEVELYEDEHWERFAAFPGITGLWQVSGRCDLSFDDMIRLDIAYVRTQSLWIDLKILLLTLPAVLAGRGAA